MRRPVGWLAIAVLCSLAIAACGGPSRIASSARLSIVKPGATLGLPTSQPAAPAPRASASPMLRRTATPPTQPTSPNCPSDAPEPIAVVNGTPIPRDDYEKEVARATRHLLQQFGGSLEDAAGRLRADYLEMMIQQVLIEQAALDLGVHVPAALVEQRLGDLRDGDPEGFGSWLAANDLSEAELHEHLRRDLVTGIIRDAVTASIPRRQPHVRVRHILVPDLAMARATLSLLHGGKGFAAVAAAVSCDASTRGAGGDLGFLPRGVMSPAFDEAAFPLSVGQISDVVACETGLHIIQVVDIDPQRQVSEEYWPAVQQRGFEDWLARRRAEATIAISSAGSEPVDFRP